MASNQLPRERGLPSWQSEAHPGPTGTSLLLGTPRGAAHGSWRNHCHTPAGQVVLQGHCGLVEDQPLLHHLNLSHLEDRITPAPLSDQLEGAEGATCLLFPPQHPLRGSFLESLESREPQGRHCGPNNSRTLASALLVAFPSKQALPPWPSAWPEPPRAPREGERHFRAGVRACGVLIPGAPAKVRDCGRGGEMVVWKEVGGGFIQEGGGKGEGSCQVSIFRAEALGTGDSTTVGGVVESDTSSRARGPGLWWKVGARKGRGRGGASLSWCVGEAGQGPP